MTSIDFIVCRTCSAKSDRLFAEQGRLEARCLECSDRSQEFCRACQKPFGLGRFAAKRFYAACACEERTVDAVRCANCGSRGRGARCKCGLKLIGTSTSFVRFLPTSEASPAPVEGRPAYEPRPSRSKLTIEWGTSSGAGSQTDYRASSRPPARTLTLTLEAEPEFVKTRQSLLDRLSGTKRSGRWRRKTQVVVFGSSIRVHREDRFVERSGGPDKLAPRQLTAREKTVALGRVATLRVEGEPASRALVVRTNPPTSSNPPPSGTPLERVRFGEPLQRPDLPERLELLTELRSDQAETVLDELQAFLVAHDMVNKLIR